MKQDKKNGLLDAIDRIVDKIEAGTGEARMVDIIIDCCIEYARSCVPKRPKYNGMEHWQDGYEECRDDILSHIETDEQSLKSKQKQE